MYYDNRYIVALMNGDIRHKLGIIPDHVTWQSRYLLTRDTVLGPE